MGPAIGRFLKAVSRLAKNGDITIDEVYDFAKREFGEVSDLLKLQINKIFKQSDAPSIKKPRKEGEVIETSFKPGRDKTGKVVEESESQRLGLASLKNPRRPGGGLDQVTGITRALARRILDRKGIEIGKKDPIDAFTDTFGEAIGDVKNLAEEMIEIDARGGGMKDMDKMLEIEGLYDIEIPKNPSKGLTDKKMLDLIEETEQEDILKKFDPEDREPNAMGGLNRIKYKVGTALKLIPLLKNKGTSFAKEIKKAIDNFIQPSGDKKYDADVILDDMLEELNIDRDMIDQKDILDAYDEIYTTISKPRSFKGVEIKDPKFDEGMPFDNDAEKLAEIKMSNENFDLEEGLDDLDNLNLGSKKGDVVSKQLKIMRLAEDIQPGLFEKLNDTQLDIIVKYGDRIDEDLLKNIILDPDPSNQAAAVATLDEVETMMGKGMSTDEIMNALQSTPRRKQAEGGLSYLMGM
jgi:hypothetical protein